MNEISLSQFLVEIKNAVKGVFAQTYWIVAEISEISVNYSGHVYLELLEKETASEHICAKARATIWSSRARLLVPYFQTVTNQELCSGLKVLVEVTVEFHEVYGLSLNIVNINPEFTLGEQALQLRQILEKLHDDGIADLNKSLEIPLLPKNIAIISSATAAGYEDFVNQIDNNGYGYRFHLKLFPAIMQGQDAENSLIAALDKIYSYLPHFDVVVIIRGGGSKSDLSCFNNYNVASNIAQFPLPVITGIGHERDESVADIVANTSMKTPTAVAEFLLSRFSAYQASLDEVLRRFEVASRSVIDSICKQIDLHALSLQKSVTVMIDKRKLNLLSISQNIKTSVFNESKLLQQQLHFFAEKTRVATSVYSTNKKSEILYLSKDLINSVNKRILAHKQNLDRAELISEINNPLLLMKRGYSIVTDSEGKIVKSINQIKITDEISVKFSDGSISSVVKKVIDGE
ncbi:MAG: exodeoxyribonuclease VII large subunit [Bacteroidales bacterium]|nr:exodeoxyribonuclease VII large subunit [Bacteroidales bacterium]